MDDPRPADVIVPALYAELRELARARLLRERRDHTLQATALVHEAYLRLLEQRELDETDRRSFVVQAAVTLRRVLIDYARARSTDKRGGDRTRVTFFEPLDPRSGADVDLLALDEALERLAALDHQQARLVELRFFGELTWQEIADELGLSLRSVHNQWEKARSWLYWQLEKGEGG